MSNLRAFKAVPAVPVSRGGGSTPHALGFGKSSGFGRGKRVKKFIEHVPSVGLSVTHSNTNAGGALCVFFFLYKGSLRLIMGRSNLKKGK